MLAVSPILAVILSDVEGPAVAFRNRPTPQMNGCPRSLAFGDRGKHKRAPTVDRVITSGFEGPAVAFRNPPTPLNG
jgi:hypothetical protein